MVSFLLQPIAKPQALDEPASASARNNLCEVRAKGCLCEQFVGVKAKRTGRHEALDEFGVVFVG